jgi:hypothetical protein
MTISSLNSSSSTYATALTAAGQTSAQATQNTQATQAQNSGAKHDGDGTIISELKASLAAQGFSQATSGMSKKDYETTMHNFVHAAFDAAHAQKQADHAGAQGNTADTAEAFSELGNGQGNVPQSLQDAFAALQSGQKSGNGMTATLSQVLQGMSNQAQGNNMANNAAGSLVDVAA